MVKHVNYRKITPTVVENENTMRNKLNFFQIWKVAHITFPTVGKTNSGFAILICIFPRAGNYFKPYSAKTTNAGIGVTHLMFVEYKAMLLRPIKAF